ncbi:uncharacterized protein LOC100840868 [Brachypodium distachyon]|uniref:Uncharacterized protein n=2 Tax=Brachypodium TaxID=15367 RepID=I1IR41_BRADI|nr:uncharacterized protein LOC100840868 [Brachypodium distachyon]KQJ90680.1 hypothetical protein BRADI_4g33260v3 [Brachypodium distachyon]CAJ26358.1 hypothetical protein [Brachypodium sylvaticum]|eukprot:XP_003578297.1 uncharacterized protein LOC100840868 [Brachypodium distachyon]
MCCCPSKACCICTIIILVLVAVGIVFGFGIYTRGFHKLTSNIHLQEPSYGGGRSFRAYGHLAPPPPY